MEVYKKLSYVTIGVGLTLILQTGYRAITSPDIIYRHKHFENGGVIVDAKGAKFEGYTFKGGTEDAKGVEAMVKEALSDFNNWRLLEQVGIESNQPIRELRIEIKK